MEVKTDNQQLWGLGSSLNRKLLFNAKPTLNILYLKKTMFLIEKKTITWF